MATRSRPYGFCDDFVVASALAIATNHDTRPSLILTPSYNNTLADPHIRLESTSRALKRCGEIRYSGRRFQGSSIEQPRNPRSKLIALLELTEGLVQYVYQFWLADEIRGRVVQIQTWNSIMPLVNVVRRMWKEGAATDRQRAMWPHVRILSIQFECRRILLI